MANYYGSEYTDAFVSVPSVKLDNTLHHGGIKRAYASYTVPSANELTTSDELYLMKLPKGARVIDGAVNAESDGTTGQFNIGWQANGSDAADADGFFVGSTSVDVGAGAVDVKMPKTRPGYNKKFAAETIVSLVPAEDTTDYGTKVIEVELWYVLD